MDVAIILLGIAAVIGTGLLLYGLRNLTRASKWAQFLQALFTILALTLAAYWYFVERRGLPHADVSQTVSVIPLGNDMIAVEALVSVKNLGERLLHIERVQSFLQYIEAGTYGYGDLAQLRGDDYWRAQRPGGDSQFDAAELRWPVARRFVGPVDHPIEPGETDVITITFLLHCSSVRHLRVATDVIRPGTGSEREMAWKARNIVAVCSQCCAQEREEM